MDTIEEFDKQKTKVLTYILYQKRTEYEIRRKFASTINENMLENIISYLKEANYINDKELIEKMIHNFKILKNLSIKEIQYKLMAKGLDKTEIEDYIYENKEELTEYEIQSAKNMLDKKATSMEQPEIKQYLLKKGYQLENIQKAIEGV